MKKVGILIDDGYHDLELWLPYYRFREEGIDFDVLAWEDREYKGVYGVDSVKPTHVLGSADIDYDLIYIPGANSPTNLLKHHGTVDLIRSMSSKGTTFATICHGPLVLAEADLVKDIEMTGHPSIQTELKKHGAKYVDMPYVRSSDNIITGKTHFQIDRFIPELLSVIKE